MTIQGRAAEFGSPAESVHVTDLLPRFGKSRLGSRFGLCKRGFDVGVSVFVILPLLLPIGLLVLVLNPFFNKGPLFFVQRRMGAGCQPFLAIKFRTMRPADSVTRAANDPLESDRITPLGAVLRKLRIDELPQILNVINGDMSLIGPRPDFFDHAVTYIDTIPRYRHRHQIRPGISGLAQTEIGYVQSIRETRRKVSADLYYIRHASLRLDAWIVWRTLVTVLLRRGA
ncbi:putative glycosyltransferase [Oceanicola granulosus HTCC2516]|uniref:Putative glycosyltransferase n=1 Tax=Oceanicola granulosus (strain ATCC BAA-861 / DSM 15982 / KCTC 12143 / HTCC2516) TaxID=314256 RepID=Q2CHI4_OCEGH|nr:sugar transferase [Oceanicola granulosus]EAR52055.1 putative glycosyltransferase [Oceanicola granulosus HTCC2516]